MYRPFLAGSLLFLSLALLSGEATPAGDPDVARLLCGKADKAFKAKKFEEACGLYQRALEEYTPYPEARFGLAQSFEKLGRTAEAIAAYTKIGEDVRALPAATRPQMKLTEDAEKAVLRLSQGYATLDQVDQQLFKRAMELGRQYMKSHPEWAKKFFHVALLIQPDNALATTLMKQLADIETPSVGGGVFESQMMDPGMGNWKPGLDKTIEFRKGVLHLNALGDSCSDFLTTRLSGRYAVRASLRMVEVGPGRACGIFLGREPPKDAYAVLVARGGDVAITNLSKRGAEELGTRILSDFSFTDWHQIEVHVDGAKVRCLIDGQEVCDGTAKDPEAFAGNTGIFAQDCRLEVREFAVMR
jgi:hypothetical protein